MRLRRPFVLLAVLVAAALVAPRPAAAQQADVIRGRVFGPDSVPVVGATVTATSISGNVTRSARTDRQGRFTIMFPGGDGDYMVSFAAMGYAKRTFEVKRVADEEILLADAKLTRAAAVLDAVKVTAPRERVARGETPAPDVGGTEQGVSNAALPAADMGDLAAMAASLPGVQLVPGENGDPNGFSVLGLGADQNSTTLNGMQFGGSSLPRDAAVSTSLVTSPYDVSRGGFSGAQFNLRTRAGSNFITRGSSLNLDAPQLQWTDRAARALGQQYSNISLGGLVSGPIVRDKAFYNLSYQLGRRANDYQSLLNTSASGLQAAGVAADSVTRLLAILQGGGVPLAVGRTPNQRANDQGSLFGSIDVAPPSSASGQALSVAFNGSWNRQRPATASSNELPAHSGERTSASGGVQARHNTYIRNTILSETSLNLSGSRTASDPYLAMPSGTVRVNSSFPDGTSGVQALQFGGNPFLDMTQSSTTAGFMNQLSWFSLNNKHRLKLTSELRREGFDQVLASNTLGSFSFNSLADLEAGRPASFSRQLQPRTRAASQLVGGASLGDAWRVTPRLQFQYGLRVDGNRFLDAPRYNAAVDSLFGMRNDRAPSDAYLSPRLGFSWGYGTAPQVEGFAGQSRGPRAVIRGGAGIFQGTPGVSSIGSALDATGLPSGVQQVVCTGGATPVPDWDAWAAGAATIPTTCADGTAGTPFASTQPNVTLFSKDWRAPRSLRSNLQWSGPVLGNRFNVTLDGTWSANMNQGSTVDLNFAGVPRFQLGAEGNRPVYAPPTSITPATGVVAARESRLAPGFNRVTEMRSDMRSESRQLTARLAPARFSTNFNWSLSYVYANVRERYRGTTSTAGDPLAIDWSRGSMDSRHQVTYSLGYNLADAVRLNWFGSFRSGTPYTPTVAGDINGDGYANDRAFIFDPARTDDPALASAMQALLASGSAGARKCLRSQLGRVAGRNSCQGPWTSNATLSISFNPVKVRMPQRASLSFQLSNPLAAADLALHGSNGLKGWGQPAQLDPALLYVRGFDPATQRYRYDVNQRFGNASPQVSAFRAPVTLTALLRFDVGPTRERQMLTQQLDRGRRTEGTKLAEPFIKAMYGTGGVPNPIAAVLRAQDSLKLTTVQADSLATLNRWYVIRVDSIWTPVAKQLAELPDRYDQGEAYDRYLRARRASVDLLAKLAPMVKGLLTDAQERKLPPFIAVYLEPRYLASIRNGTATFSGSGMMPMAGTQVMMGGGGNVEVRMIRH